MAERQRDWALILGGSSGFGLATARELAGRGFHLAVVHRDRRGAMARIEREFDAIRARGAHLLAFNRDALEADSRAAILDELAARLPAGHRIRLLLHSIAWGNLRPLVPTPAVRRHAGDALAALAAHLAVPVEELRVAAARAFREHDLPALHPLVTAGGEQAPPLDEEDFARTIHAMGTSLAGWTRAVHERGLFAEPASVVGLTSEGNAVAWPGYAAVAAAKAVLESIARSLAVEMGPLGLRVNILQPGVTDTPALRHIPGHESIRARARLRNPLGRLTRPEDVAGVVYLLTRPEAAWINGALIRVDGGEAISGLG